MSERRVFSAEEMKQIRLLFADGCNLRQICDIFGIQPYEARAAILGPEYIADFDDPSEYKGEFKRGGASQVEIECINLLFSRGMPKKKIIRLFQRDPAQIDSILNPAQAGRIEPGTKMARKPVKTATWGDYVPVEAFASRVRYGRANRNAGRVYGTWD